MKPLHHAYMKYLDTLPKEKQAELIAENIKTTMRQTQYKAKCTCGERFQTTNINTIDPWCETHQQLHCTHPNPIIEIWETR